MLFALAVQQNECEDKCIMKFSPGEIGQTQPRSCALHILGHCRFLMSHGNLTRLLMTVTVEYPDSNAAKSVENLFSSN